MKSIIFRLVLALAAFAIVPNVLAAGITSARPRMSVPAYERPKALACESGCVGDPINTGSGNLWEAYVDYSSKEAYPLSFFRVYNSLIAEEESSPDGAFENLGHGWTTNMARHLHLSMSPLPPGKDRPGPCVDHGFAFACPPADPMSDRPYVIGVVVWGSDGRQQRFYYDGVGRPAIGTRFNNEVGTTGELRIAAVSERNTVTSYLYTSVEGEQQVYDGSGLLISTADSRGLRQTYQYDDTGELVSVTGPFGRKLRLAYDSQRRLKILSDPAGGNITYAYDLVGNLASVTFQDQTQTRYLYEDIAHPYSLTGVIDQDGNRFVTWQFDSQGRAISSALADGTDQVRLNFNPDGSEDVVEVDRPDRHLTFTSINGRQEMATSSAPCKDCNVKAISYNKNGFIESETDFDGNVTHYSYDAAGHGISTSSDKSLAANSSSTPSSRSEASTAASTPPSPTFDTRGLLISLTGADGSKTSFSYDVQGNLAEIKDSHGQLTRFLRYDAHGNALSVVDSQGVETVMTYDLEQHLLSSTKAGHKTELHYDADGQLTKFIAPSGAHIEYEYNVAHRLVSIKDSLGDTISFSLDGHGAPVGEHVFNNAQPQLTPQQIVDQMNGIMRPE